MYEVLVMIGELRRRIVWKLGLFPAVLSQRDGRNWLSAALGRSTGATRGIALWPLAVLLRDGEKKVASALELVGHRPYLRLVFLRPQLFHGRNEE